MSNLCGHDMARFSHNDLLTQQNLFLFLDDDVILRNTTGIKQG